MALFMGGALTGPLGETVPAQKKRRDHAGPPLGLSCVVDLPQAASGSDPACRRSFSEGGRRRRRPNAPRRAAEGSGMADNRDSRAAGGKPG